MENIENHPKIDLVLLINKLDNNITYIQDDYISGDETKIFAEYKEKFFIDFFLKEDGNPIKIATYKYVLCDKPKAIIIFFHGLCGALKSSGFLAKSLAEDDFMVVGFEYRGHGKSEGRKHFFTSIEQIIDDCVEFVELMRKTFPNLPVILGGSSFGGLISYHLSLKYTEKFLGVFIFNPALKALEGWFMKSLAAIVGSIIPGYIVPSQSSKSNITKNKYVIEKSERKNKQWGTPISTLKAVLNGMKKCEETFHLYKSNIIVFMGGKDTIIDSKIAFNFILNAKSVEKKLYFYQNLYHNVLLEVEIYDIIFRLKEWLNKLFYK